MKEYNELITPTLDRDSATTFIGRSKTETESMRLVENE